MTNEEAKFILNAYRANGADAGDPAFAAALAQARLDPELGAWLGRLQAFDRAVARKLAEVAPPPDLRGAILAGAKVSADGRSVAWWRRSPVLAMAASVALLFAVGLSALWTTNRASASSTLPEFAADYVAGGFFLSEHSANVDELKAWLARQSAPLPTELPAGFRQLRGLGCKTIEYRGKNISLMCFGHGKEYHLFVANRADFPDLAGIDAPQFMNHKGLAAASWSDAQHHYVVVTDDTMKALRECLSCDNS